MVPRTKLILAVSLEIWTKLSIAITISDASSLFSSFGTPQNATFDYIVIGGGTGGLTVAHQLASSSTVAVIEAGGFYEIQNGNGSIIPAQAPLQSVGSQENLTLPLIDWGIVTTPQSALNNRRLHYARGKTLGGSSALNYMVYHRATKGSYQAWADQVGDESFTWESLLPYFERSARLTPPNYAKRNSNDTVQYDTSVWDDSIAGPLSVAWPNYVDPVATSFIDGLPSIGLSPNDLNFNSGYLNGTAWTTFTITGDSQHRDSSESSYLQDSLRMTDIVIYSESMAKQILFDQNKTATGVTVAQGPLEFTISASKEVILSAGVMQSPQILIVSGIGPSEVLSKYNIPIISGLKGVGQNLQVAIADDQPWFGVSYRVNVTTPSTAINDPSVGAVWAEQYIKNASGPLTNVVGALAWEKIPDSYRQSFTETTNQTLASLPQDWPEVEYGVNGGVTGYNLNNAKSDPADGYNYASTIAILGATSSRGNITIATTDTNDLPVVNPAWLSSPVDQQLAIAAFHRLRDIWNSMSDITVGDEYFPGPSIETDEQILDFIKKALITVWHASCTCAMGKPGDENAVVDTQARVFGVNSLRIVDSSIFPFLPPGHPQATLYALALKIADDILSG